MLPSTIHSLLWVIPSPSPFLSPFPPPPSPPEKDKNVEAARVSARQVHVLDCFLKVLRNKWLVREGDGGSGKKGAWWEEEGESARE